MEARTSTTRASKHSIGRLFGVVFVAICLIGSALSIGLPRGSKAANEPVVLNPAADTFASSEEADKAYGHYSHIDVRGQPATTAFLRFDVGGLGQNSVAQAHLRL